MKRRHRIRRTLILGTIVGVVLLSGILYAGVLPARPQRQHCSRVFHLYAGHAD